MWLPRMSVLTRGRGKKISSICRLSLRNSFAVRFVCLCRRKWTREATLMYLPRVPRRLSFVEICARLRAVPCPSSPVTHVLRSPLCETMRETNRLRRRLLMYYLAGRYPSIHIFFFFCLRQLMSTAFNGSLPGQLTPIE